MPGQVKNLVICNLQNTPYDESAVLRVYAKCDDFMKLVMQKLNIAIPSFILRRRLAIDFNKSQFVVRAVDFDNTPASIFPAIMVNGTKIEGEPLIYKVPEDCKEADIILSFYGHYNEPAVNLKIGIKPVGTCYYDLFYDPMTGEWNVEEKGSKVEFIEVLKSAPRVRKPDVARNPKPTLQTGFSVQPKTNCTHFSDHVTMGVIPMIAPAFHNSKCKTCQDISENWICLTCGETCCSRYVKGHAKEHNGTTQHPIAMSFSDLSLWCYSCKDYITSPLLSGFTSELHNAKFGEIVTKDKRN
jgi:hypothetical protein